MGVCIILFWVAMQLLQQTSPEAGHGRGLVFGQIYTQSGELVISTAQEGMLRKTNHGVKSRL
jgi:acyl-CoA thioesterase